MATDLAPVTPTVLRWARESMGVSLADASRRASVTPQRLEAWETGQAEPTVAQLRALGKLYQRPLVVFFLPEPPLRFAALRDFRKLPGREDIPWSRALHKVFRRATEQQEIVVELLEDEGEAPVWEVPQVTTDIEIEEVATIARTALGVTLRDQHSWRRPEEAFSHWLEAVEALGVMVLRTSDVSTDEMRGFAMSDGPVPTIVVNALDWPRGQTFTLVHEFVHLMLREAALCDLFEPHTAMVPSPESFSNAAAAAILMPRASLLSEPAVRQSGVRDWDDQTLMLLSTRYGASQEAVLRRLVALSRASLDFYLAKRDEYLEVYAAQRQEAQARRRRTRGGPPPHRMVLRDRGRPYVRLVLDAYHREAIGPSSLSSLLGLKLKHLPRLQREAGMGL